MLTGTGKTVQEWDGMAEVLVRDLEGYKKALGDPEYLGELKAEEEFLFDGGAEGMAVTVGYEVVFLEGGEALEQGKRVM